MCIRDSKESARLGTDGYTLLIDDEVENTPNKIEDAVDDIICLLYTSDAADERSSVDLGGRRIIKKKNNVRGGRDRILASPGRNSKIEQ